MNFDYARNPTSRANYQVEDEYILGFHPHQQSSHRSGHDVSSRFISSTYVDEVVVNDSCVRFVPMMQSSSDHELIYNFSCHFVINSPTEGHLTTHLAYSVMKVEQSRRAGETLNEAALNIHKSLILLGICVVFMIQSTIFV